MGGMQNYIDYVHCTWLILYSAKFSTNCTSTVYTLHMSIQNTTVSITELNCIVHSW